MGNRVHPATEAPEPNKVLAPNKVTVQEDVRPDPRKRDALFQAFADYLKTSNPQKTAVNLEPQQRETLFQAFAEYQKRQHMMILPLPWSRSLIWEPGPT